MNLVIISAIFFYLTAVLTQLFAVYGAMRHARAWLLFLGGIAVCLHAVVLHAWIDLSVGQNITVINMMSLVSWLVALLVLVVASFRRIEILVTIVFPLAVFSILFALLFPGLYIVQTLSHPQTLFHILLSVLTFGVLCFAGLLALLLAAQEYVLRHKKVMPMVRRLPALTSMETLLFQVIGLGFILLNGVLFSSLYFYRSIILWQQSHWPKFVTVGLAWWVFAILLLGRHFRGWRGRKAIYYTLLGVGLLLCAYVLSGSSWSMA